MPVHDGPWGCRLPRLTALVTVALAAMLSAELGRADKIEHYLVVLVGALALTALIAAWRVVVANSFEVRLTIGAIGAVSLVGQMLASAVGNPGGGAGPHLDCVSVGVILLAALGLGLVVLDPRPAAADQAEHPYAL